MSDRYYNPFQGIDVAVPTEFRDDFSRFCQTGGSTIIDRSPFPRMVDMWFTAICISARKGLSPIGLERRETYKIIEGSIFGNDPWRAHALMLLAVAHTGDVGIVSDPRRMMAIANGFAVAGLPHLVEILKEVEAEPIWSLSEGVEALMRGAPARLRTPPNNP
jgi:hypothetical protein